MEGLTEGRIVHYVATEQDAIAANRRRVLGAGHGESWPAGAQAHIGNDLRAGDHCPAIVVRVWSTSTANLQVFLDGNDVLWETSRAFSETPEPGTWHWIEKA